MGAGVKPWLPRPASLPPPSPAPAAAGVLTGTKARARGVVSADNLNPQKARIPLAPALTADPAAIEAMFEEYQMPVQQSTEEYVAAWHGIQPPNDPARRMAADLATTIAAFEAQRSLLQFEDEPSSFEATLQEFKE